MQINITKGEATLRLTKTELKTLVRAQAICAGIARIRADEVCAAELGLLIKTFDAEGVEVSPSTYPEKMEDINDE